jgi:plastocyanin
LTWLHVLARVSLFTLLGATAIAADEPQPADGVNRGATTVRMGSLSFVPSRIEIHVGTAVVWANEARTVHSVTSDDGGQSFATGEVEPGKTSKPITFRDSGEFNYHCGIHGQTMHGTIVVSAQGLPELQHQQNMK